MKTKTVYVLGAGFSKEADAPSQEELVSKIFEIHETNPDVLGKVKIEKFKSVLLNTYCIPDNFQKTIPLEDLFTPLDRCLIDNISFRNLSTREIKEFRNLIYELIGKCLEHLLMYSEKEYIDVFAKHLINTASVRKSKMYGKVDPIAVISTNWDILLDNSIHNNIDFPNNDCVVDYCCYVSSYDKHDNSIKPGLEVLGRGGFNVKLLKLHGSLNWLQCPRCQRIYIKFNTKIAMNPFTDINKPSCRHCDSNFGIQSDSHSLTSNLIMPTFLKDFSNPQYKIIWQNAGIELSEAKKIIFIGYSLPASDFEMRQLLSRMVGQDTEIEVVDYKSNKDDGANFNAVIGRYKQFFGREIFSHDKGTKDYILTSFKGKLPKEY